ncbi:MAG: RHS repeat protein [Ruminococcaceae bacterium]|nr:RHS repeat protein [Oscillospiraceae bacterium]
MKKIRKLSVKTLSVFLSLLLVLLSLPLSVFAEDIRQALAQNGGEALSAESEEIMELTELRTADSKTFRLENGSYYLAQYESPVHALDENGDWKEIDNRLQVEGSEITTSNARVKFVKKTGGSGSLFTLHDANRKLELSLIGAQKKVRGEILAPAEDESEMTELQKMTFLENLCATVQYKDILENVDLEYVLNGLHIKENIIVKARGEDYSYAFALSLNNLIAVASEDGGILLANPETMAPLYQIPAPTVVDAAGVTSEAVAMSLVDHGNGSYTITITADREWMNDTERAYPVTIDPPIYSINNSSILDLSIHYTEPTTTYLSGAELTVGTHWRTYWRMNTLPTLPSSAYITNATFSMRCVSSEEVSQYVAVYDVTSSWDQYLNWNNTVATSNSMGKPAANYTDFFHVETVYRDNIETYIPKDITCTWNITPIVKKWYTGVNYGMMFGPATDTIAVGDAIFCSNDSATVSERPVLCIEYRDMKGLEDYWTYSSQSAGFAGAGSVNHATGNLVFAIPTLTSTDALMPYTPTVIYNSSMAGQKYQYPNVQTSYWGSDVAIGFKQNIHETVLEKNYVKKDGSIGTYMIWADADGTEHYFLLREEVDNVKYYDDEDGLLLTLAKTNTAVTITDSSETVRHFTNLGGTPAGTVSGWYLTSIEDRSGNRVVFTFDYGPRPIGVNLYPNDSTTPIEQLKLAYDSNYLLYAVWNPTSGEAVIFRHSATPTGSISTSGSNYLRQTVRLHKSTESTLTQSELLAFYNTNANANHGSLVVDAVADYSYDSNGYLYSVKNGMTGYRLYYTLDHYNRVINVAESAYNGTRYVSGQQIGIEYNTDSTVITTSGSNDVLDDPEASDYSGIDDDLRTTYVFDYEGRTVSCYTTDSDGTRLYGASSGQYVGEENEKAKNNLKSSVQTTQSSSNYLLNGGFEQYTGSTLNVWQTTGSVRRIATLLVDRYDVGHSWAELKVNQNVNSSSIYQNVALSEGTYSLSMVVNTFEAEGAQIYLKAESVTNSQNRFVKEVPVNEYYATVTTVFANLDFTVPASGGNETYKISVVVTGSPAQEIVVEVGNLMLSKTTGTAEYDMLEMGHFETTGANPSSVWSNVNTNAVSVGASGIGVFGNVLRVSQSLTSSVIPQQQIAVANNDRKQNYDNDFYAEWDPILFTLSGFAKGTAQSQSESSVFGIEVIVKYYNGTSDAPTETHTFHFNKEITDWQFMSNTFVTDPGKGIVDTITVKLLYLKNPGVGSFDNISLVVDSTGSAVYSYNEYGYLASSMSGHNRAWNAYDGNHNVIRSASSGGTVMEYEYDSNNRVICERTKRYVRGRIYNPNSISENDIQEMYFTTYAYDDYGLLTNTVTQNSDGTNQQFNQRTEYYLSNSPHIFGAVYLEEDTRSNVTLYFRNEKNGRLIASATTPDNNGVYYEYDAIGNLVHTLPARLTVTTDPNTDQPIYSYSQVTNSASVDYDYDAVTQRLTGIYTESSSYFFAYDAFGNTTGVTVGGYELASYEYNANNGKLSVLNYGNGLSVKYLYDMLDRVEEICYNTGVNGAYETVYSYAYDSRGNLSSVTDHRNDEVTVYKYDRAGRFDTSYTYNSETMLNQSGIRMSYDESSRLVWLSQSVDYACPTGNYHGDDYSADSYYYYSYGNETGYLERVSLSGDGITGTINPQYDVFGRTDYKTIDLNASDADAFYNYVNYEYLIDDGYKLTHLVSQVTSEIRVGAGTSVLSATTYNYTYDSRGNITQITDSNGVVQYRYAYDNLGQLIREDNRPLNCSYEYIYDNAGNILEKKQYAFTTGALGSAQDYSMFLYGDSTGWGDLLTIYNGDEIIYDEIGNPIFMGYYDPDYYSGAGYVFEWEGRQLVSMWYCYFSEYGEYYESSDECIFTYNADGIRTSKTAQGTTYEYILNGSQVIGQKWVRRDVEHLMLFVYDEMGAPIGIKYRTSDYTADVFDCYFFEKNLQGDIVAVYDSTGRKIGTYTYNAWGVCTAQGVSGNSAFETNLVELYNPFRYRGYFYDAETKYYYLQSRYYNPEWCRFLNADGYVSTGQGLLSYNMFAYCNNDPINQSDSQGTWPRWITEAVAVGALLACGVGLVTGNVALTCVAWKVATVATTALAVQTWHYDVRAAKNEGVPNDLSTAEQTNKDDIIPNVKDDFHQFSAGEKRNKKVTWRNGQEGVYGSGGELVTDARDIGTYNFVNADGIVGLIGHTFVDVIPYFIFGNNDEDPGPLINYPIKWCEEVFA